MELHPSLRDNVRLLGELLGQIMVTDKGGAFLQRDRELPEQPMVECALMASVAGIAAGMRNTG